MKYPSLKIALGGIFRLVSVRHRFQHVKLPQCTNFHAGITICTIHVLTTQLVLFYYVKCFPQILEPFSHYFNHFGVYFEAL